MPNRRSFTLVELLVVISIISVLAAMLLPVLAKARDSALGIACTNNLKQQFSAFQFYASDNSDYYPAPYYGYGMEGSHWTMWCWSLYTGRYLYGRDFYVDASKAWKKSAYFCTVEKVSPPTGAVGTMSYDGYHYGMNHQISKYRNPTLITTQFQQLPVRQDVVCSPSRAVLVGEIWGNGVTTDQWHFFNYNGNIPHSGGSNWLYADGHAQWLIFDKVPVNGASNNDFWSGAP